MEQELEQLQQTPETPAEAPARAFDEEIRELLEARPELRGEELPEEVVRACMGGKRVREAYTDYARQQQRLARTRRQNEAAAQRAPIRSVTRGGGTNAQPEDPFLRGFSKQW